MDAFLKSGQVSSNTGDKGTTTSKSISKVKHVPWVEKYRPRKVSDVVEQSDVIAVLEQCIKGADLPNLLFYGPPGTGKTSTILAAAHQLFGDSTKDRILELNASDERGIQVIRDRVKTFSQLAVSATKPNGEPCPTFKIVILDEADSMTHAAQTALRRTIEKECKTTRFCLICNYVSKIIEPITSRCTKFRFKPLNESLIFERLQYICDEEKLTFDNEALTRLVEASGGDLRRAITCLQSCARLKGAQSTISIETVLEVTGIIPNKWIQDYIEVCQTGDPKKLFDFIDGFMYEAYSIAQFLEQFNEVLIFSNEFNDKQKALIVKQLGIVSHRLQEGGNAPLQLFSLGSTIIKANSLK